MLQHGALALSQRPCAIRGSFTETKWKDSAPRSVDYGAAPILSLKVCFMGLILLIVIVLLLMGGLPTWNHSRNWGYGPSGVLGFLLMIVLILVIFEHIPRGF